MKPNEIRVLLASIIALVVASASIGAKPGLVSGFQTSNNAEIKVCIELNDSTGFNFSSLTGFLDYRSKVDEGWQLSALIPDSFGCFTGQVPLGAEVELQIDSRDPTIRQADRPEGTSEGYLLSADEKVDVLRASFVASNSGGKIEEHFRLSRSTAFTFDPRFLNDRSGVIYFNRGKTLGTSKQRHVNLSSFKDAKSALVIGGLDPGDWTVEVEDDQGALVLRREVTLKAGTILPLN